MWLSKNGQSPIELSKLQNQTTYFLKSLDRICDVLQKYSQPVLESVSKWYEQAVLFKEMIAQLQEMFKNSKSKAEQVQALTVLPQSLSHERIKEMFAASSRMIKNSKTLGVLARPEKKIGRPLDPKICEDVVKFYNQQDVSKEQAGKNQVISVKQSDGSRVKKRRRLVLGNLQHLYGEFCKLHRDHQISFSKFASLRPKECVLAQSSSGMHNVCLCQIHENPKLMFDHSNMKNITQFNSATDCLKMLMCSTPTPECHLRTCMMCPDSEVLRDSLLESFDNEMVEQVTYNQWEVVDRGNIVTKIDSIEDFTENFISQLLDLVPHHFIFKKQASFCKEETNNLQEGEVIVVGDFQENHSLEIQDSIQSAYFKTKQATIHTFSCYYKLNTEAKQISVGVISDHMDHSTVAVYAFQKKLILKLQAEIPFEIKKIKYFSDGCSGQYKNKYNAANVWYHQRDFKIKAEWHFFATSHGKSACDGIGGTIKRLASLHSLQQTGPGTVINSPKKLYEWAVVNIKGIVVLWVSSEEVKQEEEFLSIRFQSALSIDGIQSSHCILPNEDENYVIIKRYSLAPSGEKRRISTAEENLQLKNVRGFITFFNKEEPKWCLGFVKENNEESGIVTVQKLQLKAKKNYDYEFTDEECFVSISCILTLPKPYFASRGQVVKLYAADSKSADAVLKKHV